MTNPPTPALGYWPNPADAPTVAPVTEPVQLISPDGAIVRGLLWRSARSSPRTLVMLSHPRGDFSVHYVAPLLAAAGYAVLGFATRYVNNDTDCLHERCLVDVATAGDWARSSGYQEVVALGNSGGGSLMAYAVATGALDADGFIALAAHPGEGVFMSQVIDPSITDEADPLSVDPSLDMYNPDNGWRPWPEECQYDSAWLATYRSAQAERVARIDRVAARAETDREDARAELSHGTRGTAEWIRSRRKAVLATYLTIYRTLADPAYLDLSIDPDERSLGTVFAVGDPMVANYGYGGLARTMTTRGWLSTWSAPHSAANLVDRVAQVTCPTLIIHPTGDTEIRTHQARSIHAASGAADLTYEELSGASHYLQGRRREANDLMVDWLRARFG